MKRALLNDAEWKLQATKWTARVCKREGVTKVPWVLIASY